MAGEPYFSVSSLPWDDLQLWYIRSNLTQSHSVKVCPLRAHLYSLVVQFDDLHKIRSPLGTIEGLDLSIYDHMIEVRVCVVEYFGLYYFLIVRILVTNLCKWLMVSHEGLYSLSHTH